MSNKYLYYIEIKQCSLSAPSDLPIIGDFLRKKNFIKYLIKTLESSPLKKHCHVRKPFTFVETFPAVFNGFLFAFAGRKVLIFH